MCWNSTVVSLNIIVKNNRMFYIWPISLILISIVLSLSYMVILDITNKKRYEKIYYILKIMLLGLGPLLVILMRFYTFMKR